MSSMLASVVCLCILVACVAAKTWTTDLTQAGAPRYCVYHASDMDKYDGNASYHSFYQTHYYRMQAYGPHFDQYTSFYTGAWYYRDSYAIYTYQTDVVSQHPEYFLKDQKGNLLYIQYQCSGGTCPQYAADVGNSAYVSNWIAGATNGFAGGNYKGLWIDDVNFVWRISNGNGQAVIPHDPRTGQNMTLENWRMYFANFLTQVRNAFPNYEIVHNSIWSSDPGITDQYTKQEILAADYITFERGVNDGGLTSGTGFWSLYNVMSYVDKIHALGTNVDWHSYAATAAAAEYQMAWYWLVSNGHDTFGTSYMYHPDNWWSAYDTNLGTALNATRYTLPNGIYARYYTNGIVFSAPPGVSGTVTVSKSYKRLDGSTGSSWTLSAASGLVLIGSTALPTSHAGTASPTSHATPVNKAGYQGCYIDQSTRDLPFEYIDSAQTTVEKCVYSCGIRHYPYAGLQAGTQCFCGTTLGDYGKAADSDCTKACAGDTTELCGGSWRNSAYTVSAANVGYLGCYIDNTSHGDMKTLASATKTAQTIDACRQLCSSQGFKYAGLQAGYQCFCDNSYGSLGQSADSICNTTCTGDSTEKCGGGYHNSVFTAMSASAFPGYNPNTGGDYVPTGGQQQSGASVIAVALIPLLLLMSMLLL